MIVSLDDTKDSGITTVIDDYGLAEKRYTAQYLYAIHRCRQQATDNLDGIGMAAYQARMKRARDAYDNMGDREKAPWIFKRREHLRLQPTIDGRLKEELQKNSSISYHQLETKILHWCSSLTMNRSLSTSISPVISVQTGALVQANISLCIMMRSGSGDW